MIQQFEWKNSESFNRKEKNKISNQKFSWIGKVLGVKKKIKSCYDTTDEIFVLWYIGIIAKLPCVIGKHGKIDPLIEGIG